MLVYTIETSRRYNHRVYRGDDQDGGATPLIPGPASPAKIARAILMDCFHGNDIIVDEQQERFKNEFLIFNGREPIKITHRQIMEWFMKVIR